MSAYTHKLSYTYRQWIGHSDPMGRAEFVGTRAQCDAEAERLTKRGHRVDRIEAL
jgi:hypothetical protein